MKIKLIILLALFAFVNVFSNPLAQGEMWVRVSDDQDFLRGGILITVYDMNWNLVDTATTANYLVEQDGNAFIYMEGEPISNPSASYVIGPLEYDNDYYIVIDNKYVKLIIDEHIGTPDEHLYFRYNTFSLNASHFIFSLGIQGNWNPKTITVKNSFGGGSVKIDGIRYDNIGTNGISKTFGEPTFPHTIEAIDDQSYSGYVRKYQNWSKGSSYFTNNKTTSIFAETATYTANFLRQYDLTFKNSFVGVGNGGQIKVEGATVSSPTAVYHRLENSQQSISFAAIYQVINGIEYTFSQWDDGSSIQNRTVTPTDHHDYIAYFTGKPNNSYRGLHFNNGDPVGTPIKLYWNEHPNTNVTKYQIWRKHGKFGSYQLIATVNRGVSNHIYTDYDYSITNNTSSDNLTWYDVRAYYSVENSYADPDYLAIYGELMFKKSQDSKDSLFVSNTVIKENSIINFPNPFNPTTVVYYTLKERGNVVIKIYDMLGKEIAVLVDETKPMGEYVTQFNGNALSSGVYIMRMQINNFSTSKKILLTK